MPSPVLLKLVIQIFFCGAATVTQVGAHLVHYHLARNIYWELGTGDDLLAVPQPADLVVAVLQVHHVEGDLGDLVSVLHLVLVSLSNV